MKSILALIVVTSFGSFAPLATVDFSPHTTSPDVVQIEPGELCRKEFGKLKCRWGGECVKVGKECRSCIEGYRYHGGLGCYSCPQGTHLMFSEFETWVCRDTKR